MEKTLYEIEKLQITIASECRKYKKAIINNKPFEEVKVIYLHIKELRKEVDALMQRANKLHLNRESNLVMNDSGFMVQ